MFQVPKDEGLRRTEELIEAFRRGLKGFKSPAYNEAQLRVEFIDPFFEALGWDIYNKSHTSEQYKDVIHEDSIKVAGGTKAPDYCFRIGSEKIFFVEAKKPALNIRDNPHLPYQLRRYGWSANLKLSILTDFEELAVYDCRVRPHESDKVSTARVQYIGFEQYPEQFDDIHGLFGKEAVLQGSFDRYAESKRIRGTAPVDKEFLKEIECWRDLLARNIALRNPRLSVHELNFAVQRTIDRIIFLRICEDRGIEGYGRLEALGSGTNAYGRLLELFDRAEERYNSGLFHFEKDRGAATEPDRLTHELEIDDAALKTVFKGLYYPESPYEFSMIGADILGHVYEQFLGKVIRLTPAHHAKVEEKPEVRKAGGVYYTPTYIVDYIVKNTVGKLCEGCRGEPAAAGRPLVEGSTSAVKGKKSNKPLTASHVHKLKILDPACGSGSFLIGAYQYLLDYCRDWYAANNPEKHKNKVFRGRGGEWFLSTAEKKRLLLDCIHGVDIDPQAVEVTKLNLLLKALEGESKESLEQQLKLFRERALPDLGGNIKCGNSLIGTDFFDHHQGVLFDDEQLRRINPFDWDTEFPEIMKKGGFDVVIGNPPYVFGRDWKDLNITEESKIYLGRIYKSSPYQLDMFSIFMEKAHMLSRNFGRVGLIVPNVWLSNTYSYSTRSFILSYSNDLCITTPGANVFSGLTVDTIIYTLQKRPKPSDIFSIKNMCNGNIIEIATHEVKLYLDGSRPISTVLDSTSAILVERLKDSYPELQRFAYVTRGVHSYRLGGYGQTAFGKGPQIKRDLDEKPYHSKLGGEGYRAFIYGRDLRRFTPPKPTEYIRYGLWLAEPRKPEFFQGERVYSRKILGDRLVVTIEKTNSVADQQVYITIPKNGKFKAQFIAGILGSRLISFFIRAYYDEFHDAFPQIKISQLKSLPIPTVDKVDNKIIYDRIVELVEILIDKNMRIEMSKDPNEITRLQRQIEATDRHLDKLVYELYGMTDEEIKIVENNTE